MDDTVSRQAVLNVLDEIEAQYVFDDGHDRLLQYAKNKVAALPCEYPTPLETIHCTNEQIERLRNTILNALHEPTVVRCGKCKYLTDTVSEFDPELHLCAFGLWMEQTFFAARATTARRQCQEYMRCRSEVNRMDDLISRQAAIDALHMHLMYRMGTDSNKKRLDEWINNLPSAQPEQRYTEEELRVFAHGISLSLLSKRSAQHWRYDEDTATEIKFLERLYDKVSADMRGEQDE